MVLRWPVEVYRCDVIRPRAEAIIVGRLQPRPQRCVHTTRLHDPHHDWIMKGDVSQPFDDGYLVPILLMEPKNELRGCNSME